MTGFTARAVVFLPTNIVAMVMKAMRITPDTQLFVRPRTTVGTFSIRTSISSTVAAVETLQPQVQIPNGDQK